MMAASEAITPPITQPRVSASSRASVLTPSMAAKNTAVSARYHEVSSHSATRSSCSTGPAGDAVAGVERISSTASGISPGDSVSPPMTNITSVSSEITS